MKVEHMDRIEKNGWPDKWKGGNISVTSATDAAAFAGTAEQGELDWKSKGRRYQRLTGRYLLSRRKARIQARLRSEHGARSDGRVVLGRTGKAITFAFVSSVVRHAQNQHQNAYMT